MAGEVANSIFTMIEFFVKDQVAQVVLAVSVIVLSTISIILKALKVDVSNLLRFSSISSKAESVNKHLDGLSSDDDIVTIEALKERRRALAFQEATSGIYVRSEIREQLSELRKFDWSLDWKDFRKGLPFLIISDNKADFKTTWVDWIGILFSFGTGALFIGMGVSIFIILTSVFKSSGITLLAQLTAFISLIFHTVTAILFFDVLHQVRAAKKIEASFKKMREAKNINKEQKTENIIEDKQLLKDKAQILVKRPSSYKEMGALIGETEKVFITHKNNNGYKQPETS